MDEFLRLAFPLSSVCQEASSLCDLLLTHKEESVDLSQPIFMSVTNIICAICFSTSYENRDPILTTIQTFTEGILNCLDNENLVDIFPWLTVRLKSPLSTSNPTRTVSLMLSVSMAIFLIRLIQSSSLSPLPLTAAHDFTGFFTLKAGSHVAQAGLKLPL